MHVAEIWRYPGKSMAGEQLDTARLKPTGIEAHRVLQVRNGLGRMITSRTHPGLLGHRAALSEKGIPLVDGRPWTDPTVLADIQQIAGAGAQLVYNDGLDRFDVMPSLSQPTELLWSLGATAAVSGPTLWWAESTASMKGCGKAANSSSAT